MDLQTAKAHNGHKGSWARNGALILFFVTGILLVASLAPARAHQAGAQTSLLAGHIAYANNLL